MLKGENFASLQSLLILSYSKIIYYGKFENTAFIIISFALFDQFMKIVSQSVKNVEL